MTKGISIIRNLLHPRWKSINNQKAFKADRNHLIRRMFIPTIEKNYPGKVEGTKGWTLWMPVPLLASVLVCKRRFQVELETRNNQAIIFSGVIIAPWGLDQGLMIGVLGYV